MQSDQQFLEIPCMIAFEESLGTNLEFAVMKEDEIESSKAVLKIETRLEYAADLYGILVIPCVSKYFYFMAIR